MREFLSIHWTKGNYGTVLRTMLYFFGILYSMDVHFFTVNTQIYTYVYCIVLVYTMIHNIFINLNVCNKLLKCIL